MKAKNLINFQNGNIYKNIKNLAYETKTYPIIDIDLSNQCMRNNNPTYWYIYYYNGFQKEIWFEISCHFSTVNLTHHSINLPSDTYVATLLVEPYDF